MTLREVLNMFAYVMLLLLMLSSFLVLRDLAQHQQPSLVEAWSLVLCASPWVLTIITGQAYGVAFIASFYSGTGKAAQGHSQQRAWARQGRGQEAAHGLLWRDRVWGDNAGLMVVLELAQLDEALKPEAVRAAHRLFGRGLAKAERDHVGRLYQQAGVSEVKAHYKGWHQHKEHQ